MGIVGCYEAHFYCDCCKKFTEVTQIETRQEAIEVASRAVDGWLFRDDGTILCDVCKELENPDLIPEDKREGYEWNFDKSAE